MLGSAPLEAVLGSGVDNRNHDAVKAYIRQAADLGLSVMFIYPDSKMPADLRTPAQKRKDNTAAQQAAKEAGRRDWANVKAPAGLALATSEKTVLDRYLKRYIELFSTWAEVERNAGGEVCIVGQTVPYNKKRLDAGEIEMTKPAAVNLAVEVGGSGIVVVDCDTTAQMNRWYEACEFTPADDVPPPTIITPGHMGEGANPDDPDTWSHADGGHFWFTVPDELLPVLPRHLGAMTWGGDNGFAVLWDRRYVLIPPSTRPEGAYEQLGHVYPLPDWLGTAIMEAGERRVQRAAANNGETSSDNPELASAVDAWAEQVSWASILEPLGWTPAPRADSCGCATWTAPGDHASPKSATAHDTGCMAGRYTAVNAPLHLWTDHDAPPFTDHMGDEGWTPTFSKLQAVALIDYGGSVGKAMDEIGLTPDLSVDVDPDIVRGSTDPDAADNGDGDFELPTQVEVTITDGPDPNAPTPDPDMVIASSPEPVPEDVDLGHYCPVCNTTDGEFMLYEPDHQTSELWHRLDPDDAEGHRTNDTDAMRVPDHAPPPETPSSTAAEPEQTPSSGYAADLSDLPADFGKTTKPAPTAASPYRDTVDDPDPDVFDSPHPGVPRIAPFSHWRDMPPPEYVIDGLIEHGGLSCIIGPPGVGKSTVALDMACHIATGKRWQGRRTLKTKVLYLPGEGLAGAVQRLRAWEAAHDVELDNDLLLGNGIILVRAQNEAWGDIAAYIVRQGIGLVIFDTFARMASGLEENSATDVGKAIRRFDKLKELTNAGVLVVHHTAKGAPDVARGSSALNGALDSELLVRGATWDTAQIADEDNRIPGKPIEVWTSKQKNAEQLEQPLPLLMVNSEVVKAPLITGPNGNIDPMQGEVVLARPLPEPVVETAIRVREFLDNLPEQGATRTELVVAIRPDAYARSRADATAYWKQRIAEAVDRGLRYNLVQTLTGTPSGARYIPGPTEPDQARTLAASEVNDQE